jgi:Leucine-rich repeat (LRR) protein
MSELALQKIAEAKEQRLTRLDLGNCGITDENSEAVFEALAELEWLEELEMFPDNVEHTNNNINKITKIPHTLISLKYLHTLNINLVHTGEYETIFNWQDYGNKDANKEVAIKNSNLLSEIKNIQKLVIYGGDFENFNFINNYYNLKSISLNYCKTIEKHSLLNMPKLEELYINHCGIDLNFISYLPNLVDFHCNILKINKINFLEKSNKAESIIFGGKWQINPNIEMFKNFTNMNTLTICDANISNISVLSNLTNLENLNLSNNLIKDLSPLKYLTKITSLELYGNQIEDLSCLESLSMLEYLSLSNNKIESILPLSNLCNLRELSLYNNKIKYIPHNFLEVFVNLEEAENIFNENPLAPEFLGKTPVQLVKYLSELRSKSYHHTSIKLPNEFKLAIQKYLLSFRSYVSQTKGKNIYFETKETEDGLEIVTRATQEASLEDIQSYLNEYIALIDQAPESFNIDIRTNMTTRDYDLLILDLKNDITNLKNTLDIALLKNADLLAYFQQTNELGLIKSENKTLQEFVQYFMRIIENFSKSTTMINNQLENFGNAKAIAKQEQNQSQNQTQSFDFEAFAQTLPALQGKLNYVKEELEDHPDKGNEEIQKLLKEIEKLQKSAEEAEKATDEKDEKKLKKSTIWQRIGNFGKSLIGLRKYIDAKDVDKLGKDLQTVSNLVNAVGIDTGFDYQNFGAE